MRHSLTALFALCCSLIAAQRCLAVVFHPGDIITAQSDNFGTVVVAYPETGDRELVSLFGSVGTGPKMSRPTSIALLPDGDVLVTDTFVHQALTRIDLETGNRVDLASPSIGTGHWGTPNTVLRAGSGDIYMLASGTTSGVVVRVDLNTGNRTIISGNGVGSGPNFSSPSGTSGAAFDSRGHMIVGNYETRSVFDVDLATGNRFLVSGASRGTGPALPPVLDLVILQDESIIVSTRYFDSFPYTNSLFRIDPLTGNRTLISTDNYGDWEYERIALGSNGQLLASVPGKDAIYSVDPLTGQRTLITGNGYGTGPQLFWGDMVVLPVPEPSAFYLFAIGAAAMMSIRRKFARSC